MKQTIQNTEQLFGHMRINPANLPKWQPKTQKITFGPTGPAPA